MPKKLHAHHTIIKEKSGREQSRGIYSSERLNRKIRITCIECMIAS